MVRIKSVGIWAKLGRKYWIGNIDIVRHAAKYKLLQQFVSSHCINDKDVNDKGVKMQETKVNTNCSTWLMSECHTNVLGNCY
jgi:hypothetical protein